MAWAASAKVRKGHNTFRTDDSRGSGSGREGSGSLAPLDAARCSSWYTLLRAPVAVEGRRRVSRTVGEGKGMAMNRSLEVLATQTSESVEKVFTCDVQAWHRG